MLTHPGHFLRRYWLEALMILPLTLYIALLTFVPVIQAILLSFTDRYTNDFPDALELRLHRRAARLRLGVREHGRHHA